MSFYKCNLQFRPFFLYFCCFFLCCFCIALVALHITARCRQAEHAWNAIIKWLEYSRNICAEDWLEVPQIEIVHQGWRIAGLKFWVVSKCSLTNRSWFNNCANWLLHTFHKTNAYQCSDLCELDYRGRTSRRKAQASFFSDTLHLILGRLRFSQATQET